MIEAIAAGFASLDVSPEIRKVALDRLQRWLPRQRSQIEALVQSGAFDELLDAFRQDLPFGTGGRRGRVGPGPNRFNRYTLADVVVAHHHLLDAGRVVIGADPRHSSPELAEEAARIYLALGRPVELAREPMATPELSFAVRERAAVAGVMISASHNPPSDNGVKLYDRDGSQILPDATDAIAEGLGAHPVPALASGTIPPLDVRDAYVQAAISPVTVHAPVSLVFTALHGVGASTTARALEAAGVEVVLEPEQARPDGAFPTVPHHSPNPELPDTFARAEALAEDRGIGLVLATDPDADRLGVSERVGDQWVRLSGDEIAALLVDLRLRRWTGPRPPIVIQTEVTSPFVARLARSRGAEVIDDLLVGFKYIGAELARLEAEGTLDRFAVGVEESHGALTTPAIRDKDAACAAVAIAAAAAEGSLVGRLEALRREVGPVFTARSALRFEGAGGPDRLRGIQGALRTHPPSRLGPLAVQRVVDHLDPSGRWGPVGGPGDRASRDVLVFHGEKGRVIWRPSGTEPKIKLYVSWFGDEGALEEVRIAALDEGLSRVGLSAPRAVWDLPDVLSIEEKLRRCAE